jgi:tetratricopeptide (TPR) repeat protein
MRLARFILAGSLALVLVSGGVRAQNPADIRDQDLTPYQQALFNYKAGNYEQARAAIDAAEQAKPGDPATEILKARILTELGDFAGGEKILRGLLTPTGPATVQLALGDLLLRKHEFGGALKYYELVSQEFPSDPELGLKIIYAKVGSSDLTGAAKDTSRLTPLDPNQPSYYFAKAALAQATGNVSVADDDIQTVRTIYGITVANHYLKTYLEVFSSNHQSSSSVLTPSSATNAAPSGANP